MHIISFIYACTYVLTCLYSCSGVYEEALSSWRFQIRPKNICTHDQPTSFAGLHLQGWACSPLHDSLWSAESKQCRSGVNCWGERNTLAHSKEKEHTSTMGILGNLQYPVSTLTQVSAYLSPLSTGPSHPQLFMHLTNYAINKQNEEFVRCDDYDKVLDADTLCFSSCSICRFLFSFIFSLSLSFWTRVCLYILFQWFYPYVLNTLWHHLCPVTFFILNITTIVGKQTIGHLDDGFPQVQRPWYW